MAFLPQIPRDPPARLRLMSLWFAVFAVVMDIFAVAAGRLASAPARAAGIAATIVLLAWILRGYRRKGFPEWTTPLEAALLVTITAASSLPLRSMGVFIAVLQFRSLYVTRREFWLLPVSFGVARVVGMTLTPEPKPYDALSSTVLLQFVGLIFIGGTLFMLMQALEAQARAEGQLRIAQKMEAVGQLAGGIAHDFNNLLTVIGGHAYMVDQEIAQNPRAKEHVKGINDTVARAGSLTRQLLAFGRRQVLQPTTVNINAVVRSTARLLESVVGERIKLDIALDPAQPNIRADVGQLEQVILNLGLNARDAMPMGGTLRITTSVHEGDGGRSVQLAVSDTGVGMDADTLTHIFEPFFTTKRNGRGTGLGLATAYGIVKQSGGDIEVTSTPMKGSTFTISLPVFEGPARTASSRAGASVAPSNLGVKRAIVVEDSDGVRDFARAVLESGGAAVSVAADGVEGLEVARAEGYAFDLVVSDVVMPGLSGPEMVERLREARPDLPVLFMTGYANDALRRKDLQAGRTKLIEKPFSAEEFLAAVQDLVSP